MKGFAVLLLLCGVIASAFGFRFPASRITGTVVEIKIKKDTNKLIVRL